MKRIHKYVLAVFLLVSLWTTSIGASTYTYNITVEQPAIDVVITNTRPPDEMTFELVVDRTNPQYLLDTYSVENRSAVPIDLQAKLTITGATVTRPGSITSTGAVGLQFSQGTIPLAIFPTGTNTITVDTVDAGLTETYDLSLHTHKDFAKPLTITMDLTAKPF